MGGGGPRGRAGPRVDDAVHDPARVRHVDGEQPHRQPAQRAAAQHVARPPPPRQQPQPPRRRPRIPPAAGEGRKEAAARPSLPGRAEAEGAGRPCLATGAALRPAGAHYSGDDSFIKTNK